MDGEGAGTREPMAITLPAMATTPPPPQSGDAASRPGTASAGQTDSPMTDTSTDGLGGDRAAAGSAPDGGGELDSATDEGTEDAGFSVDSSTGGPSVGSQFSKVLKSPFRWLFYASLASSLGDWIGLAAIVVLTKTLTAGDGGASRATLFSLSGVMIARILPTMLLGPIAGVFADRWDRRRLLIATDIGRAAVFLVLPFAEDVWALFLATIVIEVMATLFIPVRDAIIPTLVPRGQLVQANQLSLLASYGTLPLGGFAFAAVVVATGSAVGDAIGWDFVQARPESVAIWLNSLTFLASAWFISRIPGISGRGKLARNNEDRPGAWEEFVEGMRFLGSHPLVRALVFGVMTACMAAGTIIAIGVAFTQVLNAGDDGFGLLQGVVGTGLVVGILATSWLEPRIGRTRLFAPGVLVAGFGLVLTALMPRLDLAMVTSAIMGFGGGVAFLTGYTMLQESVSDDMRGRTFGAFNTGVRFALFVSLVVAPLIVGLIGTELQVDGVTAYAIGGVRITLLLAGMLALAGGAYSWWAIGKALSGAGIDTGAPRATTGLFIVFEGGDGAGKSTQIDLLRDALVDSGIDPVVTREPGGTRIGERIRTIVLDAETPELSDRTEAMLYAAARAQHVEEVIAPALAAHQVVIADRYVDSSVVYQGVARGLGPEEVRRLNRWGTDNIRPDLVVLLDVPADEGLRRTGASPDRLESAGLDFHRTVNEAFRRLAVMTPDIYLTVDATEDRARIHERIRAAVWERLRLSTLSDPPDEPLRPPDPPATPDDAAPSSPLPPAATDLGAPPTTAPDGPAPPGAGPPSRPPWPPDASPAAGTRTDSASPARPTRGHAGSQSSG